MTLFFSFNPIKFQNQPQKYIFFLNRANKNAKKCDFCVLSRIF